MPDHPPIDLTREWLVTNGLGGYASGTIGGEATRRYHALLIAALPPPFGRRVMLSSLVPSGLALRSFRLESGLPVWTFEVSPGVVVEQRIVLIHGQNTTIVRYRLAQGSTRLVLRPGVRLRPADGALDGPRESYDVERSGRRIEVSTPGSPTLRLLVPAMARLGSARWLEPQVRSEERERGYDSIAVEWTPGELEVELSADRDATIVVSAEAWERIEAIVGDPIADELERRAGLLRQAPRAARSGFAAQLVLAADAFLVTPPGRAGRTIIAGYHWFTDWGRDTMIALEGLTLTTGRSAEAREILLGFAAHVRDGLVPNLFPEGAAEGLYNTADATLWFFHAIDRYVSTTQDRETLARLLPTLREIVACHLRGTRFGIGVDPADGLLRQGADGHQLTWMDAKVDGWVVTPRRGKAVEINALWFNALKLLENWTSGAEADELGRWAEKARRSFQSRFWSERLGHLFDVVDGEQGDDPACRPNQLLAISLRHPVLERERWGAVLEVVRERLLTPVGLRSLAPGSAGFQARYEGDVRSRDAAYHQGTVWAWLVGPFVDAWLRVHPGDRAGARLLLGGFVAHLEEAGVGSVSEVFDAVAPFAPRGCIAQAWSVAEVLRCWMATEAESADS